MVVIGTSWIWPFACNMEDYSGKLINFKGFYKSLPQDDWMRGLLVKFRNTGQIWGLLCNFGMTQVPRLVTLTLASIFTLNETFDLLCTTSLFLSTDLFLVDHHARSCCWITSPTTSLHLRWLVNPQAKSCKTPRFGIILYVRYNNRIKPLNPTIAFWAVIRPKRLKKLCVLH